VGIRVLILTEVLFIYEGGHQQSQQQPPPPLFGKAFKFCSPFTYSLSLLKYLLFNCYYTITMLSSQALPSFNLALNYQDRYLRFSVSFFFLCFAAAALLFLAPENDASGDSSGGRKPRNCPTDS
jgi:hypothetical protein